MKIDKIKLIFISLLVLVIVMGNSSSATNVEVTTEKLSSRLQEGKQAVIILKIKNYEDVNQLGLETSLVPISSDKPLWNFGDSEPIINTNRYQQKIALNTSSLPAILTVTISGKVPDGVDRIKCDEIVLNKMHDTKLKYYEIRGDDKLINIESFDLIVNIKEDFENTLNQIRRKEFDNIKSETITVFNAGLTSEAQKIALEMNAIKWPGNLKLFGLFTIESDMTINIIIVVLILICLIIGYLFGSRRTDED